MKLGCIGDDFTGSSDLANTLAKQGMRVVQYSGIPTTPAAAGVDAGVVALKTRSIAPEDAVRQSLEALEWLQAQGCTQFFFKYCSTFDSTPAGNIGPVADALAHALTADRVIVCPAFPGTGRSVYQGHLFVNDRLLSESGMQNHPLTPMTDPDIRRWLAPQTRHAVGHVEAETVFGGAAHISEALRAQHAAGKLNIVVDALRDADLMEIGRAAKDLRLVTGGSGVALGLPENFGCTPGNPDWRGQPGPVLALSGSCSTATRAQVRYHSARHPAREVSAEEIIDERVTPDQLLAWARAAGDLPLVYTSAEPKVVAAVQERFGREQAAAAIESFFATLARQAVSAGVERIITAGGETSGAVIEALDLVELSIGPEIDPGVPALRASPRLVAALKSGNFGGEDFFEKAAGVLGQ
ncbi:MAG: 3-oxo-tetronate kinase, partial [Pseudomonadota bacterium]